MSRCERGTESVQQGAGGAAQWREGSFLSCPSSWFRCYRYGDTGKRSPDTGQLPAAGWGSPPPIHLCSGPQLPPQELLFL